MAKVRITLNEDEIKALGNILYGSDIEVIDDRCPFYVSRDVLSILRRYVNHGLNLLNLDVSKSSRLTNVEVVE